MTEHTVMTRSQSTDPIESGRALTVNAISNINDDSLIADGEAAAAAYAKSGRENILTMARGLAAARRKYPNDQEFGSWFNSSSYPAVATNKTMRAALIFIGKNDEAAAQIINNSRTIDPVAIAAAIKEAVVPVSQNVKPTAKAVPHPALRLREDLGADRQAGRLPAEQAPKPLNAKHVLNKFESDIKAIVDSGGVSGKAAKWMSNALIPLLERIREELEDESTD